MNPEWLEKINKLLIPGSVLDLCCGGGRFYPLFTEREYTGVDFEQNAINNARNNFKENKVENNWVCSDVSQFIPDKHYDNIFTWVALQHVRPEVIEKVFAMMKQFGTNIIMCERLTGPDPASSGYLWKHDYEKHFPGLKRVEEIVTDCWLMNWRQK